MKIEKLIEHPEGGRYSEVYRSESSVINSSGKKKSSLTHIYFSLEENEVSKFHRVKNNEVWNLYEGEGLFLYIWDGVSNQIELIELSKANREFCHVVQANMWQAAKPIRGKVLVGCSVAPGFEFEDFELIDPNGEEAKKVRSNFPDLLDLV